jgi:hypothetical protein
MRILSHTPAAIGAPPATAEPASDTAAP